MKKIFKRLVAAGLGVTIVAGSLAGCSSGSGTGGAGFSFSALMSAQKSVVLLYTLLYSWVQLCSPI